MRFLLLAGSSVLLLLNPTCVDARLRVSSPRGNAQGEQQQLPEVHIRQLAAEAGDLLGLGGKPEDRHFPLQLCEGDCDEDVDCDVGLVCFQREPQTPVPGCMGGDEENSKTDFCILDPNVGTFASTTVTTDMPTTSPPAVAPTKGPTETPASAPVEEQQAATGTPKFTFEPASPSPGAVSATPRPTAPPTSAPVATQSAATAPATAAPLIEIEKVGNNGSPGDIYPLGMCQGDCDSDDDCLPGLICYQRDQGENDPVPGCTGEDSSRNDYCTIDPDTVPTPVPTVFSTPAPTSSNSPSLRPSVSAIPTIPPSDMPSHVPTDMPSGGPSVSLTPTMSAAPTEVPSGAPTIETLEGIRLKLYWEEGYLWQDETIERKWCMISDYRGFPGTGKCWHGLRTEPCHQDMVYVARCDSDRRQMFSIVPMKGGTQYLIKMDADDMCMERNEYSLVLKKCSVMNPLQRFWLPRGAVYQKKFELSPITLANHCVTQSHHPKSGEVVELHKCSRARHIEHQSSFWNIY